MRKQLLLIGCCLLLLVLFGACKDTASAPTAEDLLPKNDYDLTCFSSENGFFDYDDGTRTASLGVDVSVYQGEIDWQAVREAGVEFAVVRLGYRGYTTGGLYLDDRYLENLQGAAEAGLEVGVYFFSQAINTAEAEEEAEFVLQWIDGYDVTLPIFYDWEWTTDEARTTGMDSETVTACAQAFCQTIAESGREAGVYFSQHTGYQTLNLTELQDYTFWLAEYADTPSFRFAFDWWQYTDAGTVPGIETAVDLNLRFIG
jgi:lysozyme